MGELLNIVNPLHQKTSRDYLARMVDEKITCSKVARKYGEEFWDGERRFGYGGYKYDGRWSVVAQSLIERFQLDERSRVLDIGCGKGFLLHELQNLLPGLEIRGIDISKYAIENSKEEVREYLFVHDASNPLPFENESFDLAISLGTLHNLPIHHLSVALKEMERVGRDGYLMVEGYRNVDELFNLQCWALTCESFFRPEEWVWIFEQFGYSGDYEFIFFE